MHRSDFIKKCGYACLGATGLAAILPACAPAQQLSASINGDKMIVPLSAFINKRKTQTAQYRRYVILRNEQLNYPIVVYRDSNNLYTALLLRCSHQYNELSVNGELLSCSAHGSEFDPTGRVVTGPAEDRLRQFPVSTDNENLYIQLS